MLLYKLQAFFEPDRHPFFRAYMHIRYMGKGKNGLHPFSILPVHTCNIAR